MYKSVTNLEVRYYETDKMGIVHHSNYIRYFECGRHQALADLGLPVEKIEAMGYMLPVVSVQCNYKKSAIYGDVLRIESRIEKMPRVKLEVIAEIFNQKGEKLVDGKAEIAFMNPETRKPVRVPEFVLEVLRKYIDE